MVMISDEEWCKRFNFLKNIPFIYPDGEARYKLFIEAILWMARSGAPWRLLPEKYGKWNSVYKRFSRWSNSGVWDQFHQFFIQDPDLEHFIIDSTIIRAPPCAAGAQTEPEEPSEQALGCSRGGLGTKIHIAVDALGNPLNLILTPGQAHDVKQAEDLLTGYQPEKLIADKAYDSDPLRYTLAQSGIQAVIPSRSNCKSPHSYDKHLYKEQHLIECFINKIKQFQHLFSHFDKLAKHSLSFLHFTAALIWLR